MRSFSIHHSTGLLHASPVNFMFEQRKQPTVSQRHRIPQLVAYPADVVLARHVIQRVTKPQERLRG